jgi:hypothetical protein
MALRDAFRAAERQLENFEREHRQDVKHHESWPSGWTLSGLCDIFHIL